MKRNAKVVLVSTITVIFIILFWGMAILWPWADAVRADLGDFINSSEQMIIDSHFEGTVLRVEEIPRRKNCLYSFKVDSSSLPSFNYFVKSQMSIDSTEIQIYLKCGKFHVGENVIKSVGESWF